MQTSKVRWMSFCALLGGQKHVFLAASLLNVFLGSARCCCFQRVLLYQSLGWYTDSYSVKKVIKIFLKTIIFVNILQATKCRQYTTYLLQNFARVIYKYVRNRIEIAFKKFFDIDILKLFMKWTYILHILEHDVQQCK